MDVHKLESILNPQRIALVGVTINPRSVGGKVLSNLVGGGFRGVVYPVNPDSEAVLGIQCYKDVKSLPRTPDLAVICTSADKVPGLITQCGEAGIMGIIIMSAGFREIGQEGIVLEEQIIAEQKKFPGMRILGPNCLGIIIPSRNLNISFAAGMPKVGEVAFVSQSGALCSSVLDWALGEKVGFSYFVSIGNSLDVDFADLIDYFGEDEKSKSIILYIESIKNARNFMTAARAFARTKPMVVYKAGRFPESAEAAASHTGAMASADDVYDAAFRRIGMSRVLEIGDIFDCAELIGRKKIPQGPRLGIVTNAGGPGVMATDALIAANGVLAELSEESMEQLNLSLPPFWSHGNPVDVLGDARSKRVLKATEIVAKDKNVDAVMVILTPQAMTNPGTTAKAIGQLAEKTSKPILAVWMGGGQMREGIQILNDAGVATYMTPEQGVKAFMTLVEYSRNLEVLYETPKEMPVEFSLERHELRQQLEPLFQGDDPVLSEEHSKKIIAAYGIPTTTPVPAATPDEAVKQARATGFPVVLKIASPHITHKSDVGGIALDLQDEQEVRNAFDRVTASARKHLPQARIDGVSVQPMIKVKDSLELILGAKYDPLFGTVLMVGAGGVTAELFEDRALGFPPLNERLVRRMLESLKVWPLLRGYRGKPALNVDYLVEIIIRLSYLVADFPEIKELDINPLLVGPEKIISFDARMVAEKTSRATKNRPYAHLAFRPYPEEYVQDVKLEDGTPVTLRPIKPEDEPLWMDMLAKCSRESIYARFRYHFSWESHETATHYCYIDYDREVAMVAERIHEGKGEFIGVGRLIADPDGEVVEYAILVVDDWQNRGVGNALTDCCLEIARKWGMKRIVAVTTADNARILTMFQKRDFKLEYGSDSMVEITREL